MNRRTILGVGLALLCPRMRAQDAEFVCPMDPDIRSATPGKCPRCGMRLEARILVPRTFQLEVVSHPSGIPAGRPVEFQFRLRDPETHQVITRYELVHERLFHLFAVSADLSWMLHDHPVFAANGTFKLPVTFPSAGMYELFIDVYPMGGTPQWIPHFLMTQGASHLARPKLDVKPNLLPQRDKDVEVKLELEPPQPFAGRSTNLYFRLDPGDGLELYLGTYAHGFWVSQDLLDGEHTHPLYMGDLQFQVFFPRVGLYRFWIQFQRLRTLHTVHFDIPVIG